MRDISEKQANMNAIDGLTVPRDRLIHVGVSNATDSLA